MDWFLKSSQNELENILMMTLCAGKKNTSKNQTPAIGFHRNPTITPKSRLWRNHHFPMEKIPMEKGFRQKPIFHRKRLFPMETIPAEKWGVSEKIKDAKKDVGQQGWDDVFFEDVLLALVFSKKDVSVLFPFSYISSHINLYICPYYLNDWIGSLCSL